MYPAAALAPSLQLFAGINAHLGPCRVSNTCPVGCARMSRDSLPFSASIVLHDFQGFVGF